MSAADSTADVPRLVIGAMSGTSCDGVDAALIETTGRGDAMTARYVAHVERPFEAEFKRKLLEIREHQACSFAELATLGRELTLAYAAAVRDLLAESNTRAGDVAAVAAHGQTLFHDPPNTIQWLDPSLLALETGIAVVSDFRRADCAAGGQGAPLVPFGDWVFFRHPEKTRVILNLGGIANLTYLPAGGGIEDIIAFDTGPGNCLSDHVMRARGDAACDAGGRIAMEAEPDWQRANQFIKGERFFATPPPKSLDGPELLSAYEAAVGERSGREGDLARELATCAAIVGLSVGYACVDFLPNSEHDLDEIIVGGGGVHNAAIMRQIREYPAFSSVEVRPCDDLGLPSQAREAACFAVMGSATLDGEPSNVPSATGARRRVVLGSITPAP